MILIIDDDSAVRSSLSFMLKRRDTKHRVGSRSPGSYRGSAYGSSGFDTYGYELHSLNDR